MPPAMPKKMITHATTHEDAATAETIGQRLARVRKERGLTQVQLAERVGIIQALVSDYERDKLRLNPDMTVRFAAALEVSTDQLLGSQPVETSGKQVSRKVLRRMEQIESLPRRDQDALLRTIDAFLSKAVA